MRNFLLIAALMAAASGAQAQVYRCVVDGKTVFSDLPCPAGAKAEAVRLFNDAPTAADAAAARARGQQLREQDALERAQQEAEARARSELAAERLRHMARSRQAVSDREVFVGMSAADALESWGAPTTINRSHRASGVKEQWVYREPERKTRYIYVENGQVTAIQD